MVVLRSMSLVITPPRVSTPSESGVTSSSRMSLTSPLSTPAWMAAPTATTSSGLTPLWGSLPPSRSLTSSWITGMRVEPPTSTTSSICCGVRLASFERRQERSAAALGQVGRQRLELGAGERHLEVLGACLVGGDERQVDARLQPAGELDLRLLGRLGQALQGLAVGLAGRCRSTS